MSRRARFRGGAPAPATLAALAALTAAAACGSDSERGSAASGAVGDGASAAASDVARNGLAPQSDGTGGAFGFGTPATEAIIAAWDIDVAPDGTGLPPGSGTVAEGMEVWERHRCVQCHGPTGREGPFDIIAGRNPDDEFRFATEGGPYTVGNYWPYATTLFDYTRRAMPFDAPGAMTDEEVYAVVGAMLYLNDLLPADAVVDSAVVVDTHMPARDRFVRDNRTGGPAIR